MTTSTVLLTGATGTVGSDLIPALQARGITIRAMIRGPGRPIPGVRPVVADLRDRRAVAAALEGVDAAFLNSPSTEEAAAVQIQFADLARDSGLNRLVLLSQLGARTDSPVRFLRWHAEVEAHVRQLGLDHIVLRPNLFMQALLRLAGTISQGWLPAPIGDARVSVVDTRDIAEAAAAVLTGVGRVGQIYNVTGPRAVTHAQIARALTVATGSEIRFHDVPAEAFAAALAGALPPWQIDGLVEDYAHYARGEAATVHTSVADLTGRRARDITEFARDHAERFAPA